MLQLFNERFTRVHHKLITESVDGKPKKYLVGKVQSLEVNQNRRRYGKAVWDALHESSDFQTRLDKGRLLGRIDHPKDGIFETEKSATKVVKHWVEGSDVFAKREILENMPSGKLLLALIESGVELGVSSRGRAETKMTEDSIADIVPGSLILEGYDDVPDPSVWDASSKLHQECTQYLVDNCTKYFDKESFELAKPLMESMFNSSEVLLMESQFNSNPSISDKIAQKLVESGIAEVSEETIFKVIDQGLNQFNKNMNVIESAEYKLLESSHNTLKEKMSNLKTTFEKVEGELNTLREEHATLTRRHNALKEISESIRTSSSNLESEHSELKRRYEAAKSVIEDKLGEISVMRIDLRESSANLSAAKKLIESYDNTVNEMKVTRDKRVKSEMKSLIENTVAKFPFNKRGEIKKMLSSAPNMKSLNEMISSVGRLVGVVTEDTTLPRVVKTTKVEESGKVVKLDPMVEHMAKNEPGYQTK